MRHLFEGTWNKKMATLNEPRKKRAQVGFRYSMELNFASEDAKQSFLSRMENTKQRFAPRGSPPLGSRELLSYLLDMAETTPPTNQPGTTGSQLQSQVVPTAPATMLDNSGKSALKLYLLVRYKL